MNYNKFIRDEISRIIMRMCINSTLTKIREELPHIFIFLGGNTVKYNKLIRDEVPRILMKKGVNFTMSKTTKHTHEAYLLKKLDEEISEFRQDKNIEELADILEVLLALAKYYEFDLDDVMLTLITKRKERGGFNEGYILDEIKPNLTSKK